MKDNMKGGGQIFDILFGESKKTKKTKKTLKSLSKKKISVRGSRVQAPLKTRVTLKEVTDSENELIKSIKDLRDAKINYTKSHNKHINNLITLQEMNGLRNGLVNAFKNTVFPELQTVDEIDYENPLLIQNFMGTDNFTPKYFKKEFILSQINYILHKYFDSSDVLVLDENPVIKKSSEKGKIILEYKTLLRGKVNTGDSYYRTISIDKNYLISIPETRIFLEETIKSVKKRINVFDDEFILLDDLEQGTTLNFLSRKKTTKIKLPSKDGKKIIAVAPTEKKEKLFKSKYNIPKSAEDIADKLIKELKAEDKKPQQQPKQNDGQQPKKNDGQQPKPLVKEREFGNPNNKSKKDFKKPSQKKNSKPQGGNPNPKPQGGNPNPKPQGGNPNQPGGKHGKKHGKHGKK